MSPAKYLFSTFDISRQVFFKSELSLGIVNLKPLLPGHVLVLPKRVVPRLTDLTSSEINDLFNSAQAIGRVVEKAYRAQALTVSLQDGKAAGQSVPHVHVHILPRRSTDFDGDNDKIYPALEVSERRLSKDLQQTEITAGDKPKTSHTLRSDGHPNVGGDWDVPKDEDRLPRSIEEMEKEAKWLGELILDCHE